MLRHGGLGQRENFHYFSADAGLTSGDLLEDRDPGRVTDGVGKIGQLIFFFIEFVFFVRGHYFIVYRRYTIKLRNSSANLKIYDVTSGISGIKIIEGLTS